MFITFQQFIETHYPSKDDWESQDWAIHLDDVEESGKSIVEYAKEFVKVFWKQTRKKSPDNSYVERNYRTVILGSFHILYHLYIIEKLLSEQNKEDLDNHFANILNRILPKVQEETKKSLIKLQKVQPTKYELYDKIGNNNVTIIGIYLEADNYFASLDYKKIGTTFDRTTFFSFCYYTLKSFLSPEVVKADEEYIEEFYLKL